MLHIPSLVSEVNVTAQSQLKKKNSKNSIPDDHPTWITRSPPLPSWVKGSIQNGGACHGPVLVDGATTSEETKCNVYDRASSNQEKQESSGGIYWLRLGWPTNRGFDERHRKEIFLHSKSTRLGLGVTHQPIQWQSGGFCPGCEMAVEWGWLHLRAKVKNAWSHTSTRLQGVHRDNFTLPRIKTWHCQNLRRVAFNTSASHSESAIGYFSCRDN
jgi:hypothetical protein